MSNLKGKTKQKLENVEHHLDQALTQINRSKHQLKVALGHGAGFSSIPSRTLESYVGEATLYIEQQGKLKKQIEEEFERLRQRAWDEDGKGEGAELLKKMNLYPPYFWQREDVKALQRLKETIEP